MKTLTIEDWGTISYRDAWRRQKTVQSAVQEGKRDSVLVLCQHPSVITIGKTGTAANVTASARFLESQEIEVVEIDRGGDVTLHNPGQLVGYPIIRLTDYKPDLHWFLREIEQCIIDTIADFDIVGERVDGLTGVWIERVRKICAIGIHCSRWVTAHGFALNVTNNLSEFGYIIPCGITDKSVTSVSLELSKNKRPILGFEAIRDVCAQKFFSRFS